MTKPWLFAVLSSASNFASACRSCKKIHRIAIQHFLMRPSYCATKGSTRSLCDTLWYPIGQNVVPWFPQSAWAVFCDRGRGRDCGITGDSAYNACHHLVTNRVQKKTPILKKCEELVVESIFFLINIPKRHTSKSWFFSAPFLRTPCVTWRDTGLKLIGMSSIRF